MLFPNHKLLDGTIKMIGSILYFSRIILRYFTDDIRVFFFEFIKADEDARSYDSFFDIIPIFFATLDNILLPCITDVTKL